MKKEQGTPDFVNLEKDILKFWDENHSFDNPEKDVCVFYHRDRGEDWTATRPIIYGKNRAFDTYYYLYIWENGCWTAYADGKKVNI